MELDVYIGHDGTASLEMFDGAFQVRKVYIDQFSEGRGSRVVLEDQSNPCSLSWSGIEVLLAKGDKTIPLYVSAVRSL